jgi:threonine dehydrogenase-like Zn-dependent dehydrogenase
VYAVPRGVSLRAAAYCEPVAAALAVRKAGLSASAKGLVFGKNRIAELVVRVLRHSGHRDVTVHDPAAGAPLPRDLFDFAIETTATTATMRAIVDAVRPGGTIVLKSRPYEAVGLDVAAAVTKELTLRAVGYAPFDEAIAVVAERAIPIDDLLGDAYDLDDFARAFADSQRPASPKLFFAIDAAGVDG